MCQGAAGSGAVSFVRVKKRRILPSTFYDPDDPNFGFDDQTCLGGGDCWGDFVDDSGSCCVVVPGPDVRGRPRP
jgi:hypothetical protein